MNGNCGRPAGAHQGPVPPHPHLNPWGQGRGRGCFPPCQWSSFRGIWLHLPPSSLLPCHLLCPPVLCSRLSSQAQLCHLRLVGGMGSRRLEEVLTNGPPWDCRKGPGWKPVDGRALPGNLGLLQPPSASSLGFHLGRGGRLTRERNLSLIRPWGLCLLALEGFKSSQTCPGTLL